MKEFGTQKELITCCLIDNDVFDGIIDLSPDDFVSPFKTIWSSMQALRSQNVPVDPITVGKHSNYPINELIDWADSIHSTINAKHYAKMVKEESDRKSLRKLGEDLLTMTATEEKPDSIREKLENELYTLSTSNEGSAIFAGSRMGKVLNDMEAAKMNGGVLTGLPSGFDDLDDCTGGFQNSDLIVIGARPSIGKTAIGMNIAEAISITGGKSGLIISREMSTDTILRRLVCSGANVDIMQGMRGTYRDSQAPALVNMAGKISASKLMIDDRELNINEIRAEARRQKRKNDIKYLLVDYIQLIKSKGHDSRVAEVEYVSNQLKACAKELKIPVIALAQINRETEKEKGLPRIDQLKGSGAIEQDADVIILLHREKEAATEDAVAIVAKQRNGALKIIQLRFVGHLTRFTDRQ
jgi:replicative DNA helicase